MDSAWKKVEYPQWLMEGRKCIEEVAEQLMDGDVEMDDGEGGNADDDKASDGKSVQYATNVATLRAICTPASKDGLTDAWLAYISALMQLTMAKNSQELDAMVRGFNAGKLKQILKNEQSKNVAWMQQGSPLVKTTKDALQINQLVKTIRSRLFAEKKEKSTQVLLTTRMDVANTVMKTIRQQALQAMNAARPEDNALAWLEARHYLASQYAQLLAKRFIALSDRHKMIAKARRAAVQGVQGLAENLADPKFWEAIQVQDDESKTAKQEFMRKLDAACHIPKSRDPFIHHLGFFKHLHSPLIVDIFKGYRDVKGPESVTREGGGRRAKKTQEQAKGKKLEKQSSSSSSSDDDGEEDKDEGEEDEADEEEDDDEEESEDEDEEDEDDNEDTGTELENHREFGLF